MAQEKKYNKLKLKFSKYLLNRSLKASSRTVKVCSLSEAKTVGVSFVVNNTNELEKVRKMLKILTDKGLKPFALGYIPVKKPNDFYLSQKGFNFFSDADLDMLLQPKNDSVIEFINTEFDILIDFATETYYPMYYVLQKSKAGFKVGWYGDDQPFDLMMNIERKAGLEYYLEQALHYLDKIREFHGNK